MLLLDLALRSSVLLGAGLLLSACLARRSAALRHRVLAASLLAAALVIPSSLTLPEWNVTVPAPATVSPVAAPAGAVETTAAAIVKTPPAALEPVPVIVGIWLAGVLVAAASLITGVVRVGRVAAGAARVDDPRWLEALDDAARRYGLKRGIAIARTESPDLLATWGIVRPQVLVPAQARDWTMDRIHVVLCHELAHIRRHDWLVQMAAETLRAVLWLNPLAWIVCTRLRRESEQACDDEVLGIGVGARHYATHLLALARQCRRPGFHSAAALPMAHPSTLERRIAAMLNSGLDRRPPSRRVMTALGLGLLAATVSAGSLRPRAVHQAPLSGTIYDATGAVLPGVLVTLADGKESSSTATTAASGRFEFPVVGPGKYVLEATLPGFRTLRHEFELQDPRDWERAITLQVGDLRETISVSASRSAAAEPAAAAGPQPIRVGGNVRAPRKVLDVRPIFPASMREAGLSGTVPLEAVIGKDGLVSLVRVLSAQVHPDFAIAAVDAVRQWRFTPTLLNGSPVDVVMTVSVRFDLKE